MLTSKRVLVPVDLSVGHRALTATTRKMFDRRHVEVVMLHVIEEPSLSGRGLDVERAMAQMEFLARKEFDLASVRRRVERGRAADAILEYARLHDVESIVMPAGGLASLLRSSLGHVSEEVLTGAHCAVWMEWMTGSVECVRNVCCAVRFDESDVAVVRRAREVATDLGAAMTIIHAVDPEPRKAAEILWDPGLREHEIRRARAHVDVLRQKYAPDSQLTVDIGDVASVVSRALYRIDAGLLVSSGDGEAVVAAEMACPVLRIAASPDFAGAVHVARRTA